MQFPELIKWIWSPIILSENQQLYPYFQIGLKL
jgi:hypothetical protein